MSVQQRVPSLPKSDNPALSGSIGYAHVCANCGDLIEDVRVEVEMSRGGKILWFTIQPCTCIVKKG